MGANFALWNSNMESNNTAVQVHCVVWDPELATASFARGFIWLTVQLK